MTSALWYAARGSGVVSLVLLTVVVVLGVAARSGRTPFGLPRFAVNLLHRNAALLAVVFLGVHVVTLLFDPYAQLRLLDLVVPFAGAYRPFWLGLGTTAVDLVAALVATSLLRRRLGVRAWRAVHWLAYLCWPVALLHGLGTGTDNGTGWLWAVVLACAAAVLAAAGWRLSTGFERFPGRRRPAASPPPGVPMTVSETRDLQVGVAWTGRRPSRWETPHEVVTAGRPTGPTPSAVRTGTPDRPREESR